MQLTRLKPIFAGSLLAISSVVAPVLVSTAGASTSAATARQSSSRSTPTSSLDAAGWLARQVRSDGDLPTSERESGLNNVPLALTSLVAAGTGRKQVGESLAYLKSHFESFVKSNSVYVPGRLAEVILAAVATGASPTRFGGDHPANDLVARLLGTQTKRGANAGLFGSPAAPTYSSAYTEGLALLALASTGVRNKAGAGWLVRQQCSNGGWTSYRSPSQGCPAEDPATFAGADTNSTSLAVEALVATGTKPRLSPLRFLEKAEYPDGGFGYIGVVAKSQAVDPDSTALVIQALVALGKLTDPAFDKSGGAKPERALGHFQLGCGAPVAERGSYRYPGAKGPNLLATIQAIPAAAGKAYPIGKATLSTTLPRTNCPSSKVSGLVSRTKPASTVEKSCSSVPKARSGQVIVPIVVDFGSRASKIDVTCVSVPTGSTGSNVLAERASVLHTAQPVYNSSGLLCQIDGYPSSGCGTETGGHYAYWAYFHGGSKWTYANDGPAGNDVTKGDVEGWRFEPDGSASASDPPPRAASAATVLEATPVTEEAPSTTTTTTTTTTTVTTSEPPTSTQASDGNPTSTSTARSANPTTTHPSSGSGSGPGSGSRSKSTSSGDKTATGHDNAVAVAGLSGRPVSPGSSSGRDLLLGLAGLVILLGAGFALLRSRGRVGAEG